MRANIRSNLLVRQPESCILGAKNVGLLWWRCQQRRLLAHCHRYRGIAARCARTLLSLRGTCCRAYSFLWSNVRSAIKALLGLHVLLAGVGRGLRNTRKLYVW